MSKKRFRRDDVMAPGELRYLSPLRYPGGKSRLLGFLKALLIENDLIGCEYVEPFAGGASIAIGLLAERYVRRIVINDLDPAVHAFWHTVLTAPDWLCRRVSSAVLSVSEWRRQSSIVRDQDATPEERGFACLYLNRTNRSGIVASGGLIGGLSQASSFRMDARFNRNELVRRVRLIADLGSQIEVQNRDAAELLRHRGSTRKTLIYLDPPYYIKGPRRLYSNWYLPSDHAGLATLVFESRSHWIVSYDDVLPVRRLYARARSMRYELEYSANKRSKGAESVFFSPNLVVSSFVRDQLPS